MATYTFGPAPVLVETTGEFAIGATGVLRPVGGGDPVAVYDLNDSPLASVLVGPKGAHQSFKADIPHGILDFGSVLLPTESIEQRQSAIPALQVAQEALNEASASRAAAEAAADSLANATAGALEVIGGGQARLFVVDSDAVIPPGAVPDGALVFVRDVT